MLTLDECIAISGLSLDDTLALAKREKVPAIVATRIGNRRTQSDRRSTEARRRQGDRRRRTGDR